MPLMLMFWRLLKRLLKLALAWAVEVAVAVTTATPDGRVTPEGIETPEGREMVTSWAEAMVAMVARTAAKVHFISTVDGCCRERRRNLVELRGLLIPIQVWSECGAW